MNFKNKIPAFAGMTMRYKILFALLFLFVQVNLQAQNEFTLQPGTVIRLSNTQRAKELVTTRDEYTAVLSKFDLQSKTQRKDSVTVDDYLQYTSEQVKDWTDAEKESFGKVIRSVGSKISSLGLKINMPPKIEIVKSTMKEEGGADGFTRGAYIVLQDIMVSSPKVENLFIHELFHVLSRYNPDMREKIYNSLGFHKCNEVAYPKEIADKRLTNPDAPLNNYYITVLNDNQPVDVMMILYSDLSYQGGSFFKYLKIGLMEVEGDSSSKTPVIKNNYPVIFETDKVKNFYEQVGRNTNYILHAEEISAEHFVALLNQAKDLPNPELIEAMKNAMK